MFKYKNASLGLLLGLAVAGAFIWSCVSQPTHVPPPEKPPAPTQAALQRLPVSQYPMFGDHRAYQGLAQSIQHSLTYLERLPPKRMVRFGPDQYPVSHLIRSLVFFKDLVATPISETTLNALVRANFVIYQTGRGPSQSALFTGYYEPLLQGSLTPSAQYPIPVHAKPTDLMEIDLSRFGSDLKGRRIIGRYNGQTVVPYHTRGQIRQISDFNAVAAPIAWLKDETDLFILQIQGSGKVQLTDGEVLDIQFHGSNGQPYRSVGRMLIDTGAISAGKMSMQAIRAYLKQHPDKAAAIMDHNPRYIFFKKAQGEGPFGSLGVPITPYRSIAVDHALMPSGALAFLELPMPDVDGQGAITGWAPYKGFALAQDAGSAIKGPGRADLFMGAGAMAEVGAGHLKHDGRLYFLVLKP